MTFVPPTVSIVIPVFNKLAFTRQCLDRILRHRNDTPAFEVIFVDNGSSDGTREFLSRLQAPVPVTSLYNSDNAGFARACNMGADRSSARYLLFLNNDTLVTPGWLQAMVTTAGHDPRVGIVGIKQLFPYTNRIHHTGIVFDADGRPRHLYPDVDGDLPKVNKQREYQAVTGSCLLIARDLFVSVGRFDEEYRNGYEDIDLCLSARRLGRSVICCTTTFIYHYGQISDTRTDDDDSNFKRLQSKWHGSIEADEHNYVRQDLTAIQREGDSAARIAVPRSIDRNALYFADDLSRQSALSSVTASLIDALERQGADVTMRRSEVAGVVHAAQERRFQRLMRPAPPIGGVQIRWSHYWPEHLETELNGRLNLEFFVINYHFVRPGSQPWDYWLQSVRGNGHKKLALSTFCRDVLLQTGVPAADCVVVRPGYSPEILQVAAPKRSDPRTRLLTVTNSHDLERYGTRLLLDAYVSSFTADDDVVLVVKDYGATANNTILHDLIGSGRGGPAIEYVTGFTTKEKLIELYKSCDAYVSAHRGEGYGMKIIDALACALPVITPLHGGPTDFCTEENCFPVDFDLVPVGECLDTRSLSITNGPVWAEPRVGSLGKQMRRVVGDRDEARRVGERARRDVIDRFTWDNAARELLRFVTSQADSVYQGPPESVLHTPRRDAQRTSQNTETSPYWLGCRMSVVIPTFNRAAKLMNGLRALDRQSVLPHEFEVIVVDDGSSDDTRRLLDAANFAFELTCLTQQNAGPGAARNKGLARARGELVLFMGDDIVADERLVEAHLEAHARRRNPATAVLGHIDWGTDVSASEVMRYVSGPAALQFGYSVMASLPKLDHRFFYTSNISLSRKFLADAASDGVLFDPSFSAAGFEDSEFASRLEARGLEIVHEPEARARHDHWMDVDAFSRREHAVGRMAVVYYRKHPVLDDELQVRWLGGWTDAVDALTARPDLEAKLIALDARVTNLLHGLAARLEAGLVSDGQPDRRALDAAFGAIFHTARTRGKSVEWYDSVIDQRKVRNAARLIGCVGALQCLAVLPADETGQSPPVEWLEEDHFRHIEARIESIETRVARDADSVAIVQPVVASLASIALGSRRRLREQTQQPESKDAVSRGHVLRRRLGGWLRVADLRIQYVIGRRMGGRWLNRYRSMRGTFKGVLGGGRHFH